MKYIICDDNQEFADHLKKSILKIEPDSIVVVFNSLSALNFNVEDVAGSSDAMFFDIRLRDGSGIKAAGEIIAKHPHLKVVYVTGYGDEYAQAIFENPHEADPVAFITKPIQEKYLINALKKIHEQDNRENLFITVKLNRSTVPVPIEKVIYISSDKRRLVLHTAEENISFYGKMSDLMSRLSDSFSQIHKSYAVNLRHIGIINSWSSVTLSDGTEIPVGRTFAEQFKIAVAKHSANRLNGDYA